jgi:integrase
MRCHVLTTTLKGAGKGAGKMARVINKLTDIKVRTARPGRYADGGNLYLDVAEGGSRSWLFLWKRDGRTFSAGFGGYPLTSLSRARAKAAEARAIVSQGGDPRAARRSAEEIPTFGEAAAAFLTENRSAWRNVKYRAHWDRMLLTDAFCRHLRPLRVDAIGTEDVLRALTPIWQTKFKTANDLRGQIERILDYCRVRGWRSGPNPALWRGHLKSVLPGRRKVQRKHLAAMPCSEVPAFMERLGDHPFLAAPAMMFLILVAARSREVLQMTWQEVDFEADVWTVPPERMKSGREHRVPLSPPALAILRKQLAVRNSDYVFPGEARNRPLAVSAFVTLMREMEVPFTTHGFRSSFRDWAGDMTGFPREVAEAALAHAVGDETERAYRRSDALERRRKLMAAWAEYLDGSEARGKKVVPLRG